MIAQDEIVVGVLALIRTAIVAVGGGIRVDADVDFDALGPSEERGVQVRMTSSSPDYLHAGQTAPRSWTTRLHISAGARPDKLDPATGRPSSNLLALVDAAISADPSLGGKLTLPLQLIGIQTEREPGGRPTGVLDAIYTCEHQTAWNTFTPS